MPSVLDEYSVDEYELLADITRHDYFQFFKEFNEIFVQEEMVYNWHIEYLCNELQEVLERVIRQEPVKYDLIVNVPPGMTKSSIFSITSAPWMWTRMPRFRQIVVTHTDLLGRDLSLKSRDIVKSDKYVRAFPNLELKEDQNTMGLWANNHGGYRLACTVGGRTPTGFHAHALFVDDPIDPEKAKSATEIGNATEYLRRVLPTRKVNKETVPTVMVMQRLDVDDPTGDRLKNENAGKVKHICLPCDNSWPIKPRALRRRYRKQKGLLDPKRLPRSVLKTEQAQSQFAYAGQYGQSPLPKGGIIFNVEMFEGRISKVVPDMKKLVRYWDKAYTQDGGCYTVGVKMGLGIDGKYWVIDVIRVQLESARREALIRLTAKLDGRLTKIWIEQEPAAGKESAANTIRGLAGYRVAADRRGGQNDLNKVMRADPYASQVNAGNVYLKEGPWNRDYIEELRYFSEKAKFKDQVDASSGAFNKIAGRIMIGAI